MRSVLSVVTAFSHLPFELRERIFLEACGDPSAPSPSAATAAVSNCVDMVLQLALTCREFYYIVIPLRYATVRLTTPSALAQFESTLQSSPHLIPFVRRLHIGPDAPLDRNWWPIRVGSTRYGRNAWMIVNGTASPGHPDMITIKGKVGEADDAAKAILTAFKAASHGINVNARKVRRDSSSRAIGFDTWTVRVFELQAAMELYRIEMQHGNRSHYPSLVVVKHSNPSGFSPSSRSHERGRLHLTYTDIYQRLARPGAPTDSFRHPLLFASSSIPWQARGHDGQLRCGGRLGRTPAQAVADVESLLQREIPQQMSVGGCIVLAQSILSFFKSTELEAITFSGFLEHAGHSSGSA